MCMDMQCRFFFYKMFCSVKYFIIIIMIVYTSTAIEYNNNDNDDDDDDGVFFSLASSRHLVNDNVTPFSITPSR